MVEYSNGTCMLDVILWQNQFDTVYVCVCVQMYVLGKAGYLNIGYNRSDGLPHSFHLPNFICSFEVL